MSAQAAAILAGGAMMTASYWLPEPYSFRSGPSDAWAMYFVGCALIWYGMLFGGRSG